MACQSAATTEAQPAARWLAIIALVALTASGCGEKGWVTVSGKVTYKGQPVTVGMLTFLPDAPGGQPLSGPVDQNGEYRMPAGKAAGLRCGTYKVVVYSTSDGPTPENPNAKETWLVPKKYGAVATTPLTVTVTEGGGPQTFNFELTD
jgi:hypothetical protein